MSQWGDSIATAGELDEMRMLYLGNSIISGTLPSNLSHLPQLSLLALNSCPLSGSLVPSFFGATAGWNRLYLSDTSLSGTLPPQLATLAAVDDISLELGATSLFQMAC